MPFSFVTKSMVFSYTPGVIFKKDADKKGNDTTDAKGKEGETVKEGKETKSWMSAL